MAEVKFLGVRLGRVALATSPMLPTLIDGSPEPLMQPVRSSRDIYVVNVYCCNCNPSYHFDVGIPRGIKAENCQVHCPNCGVAGVINSMHQVWPASRGRLA